MIVYKYSPINHLSLAKLKILIVCWNEAILYI